MKKEKRGKIKALIFDVGGVLQLGGNSSINHKKITSKSGVHKEIAEKLGISVDQYFDSIDTVYAKLMEGKILENKGVNIMAKNLKITPKKLRKIYTQSYKKHFSLNNKLFDYTKAIKKKGYKVAILSDQWPVSKKALITKKTYEVFKPVVLSCDVQMRKPDPRVYKLTLKKLRLKPKETVFIDNQKWNFPPARKLGMKTVLFKKTEQTIKDLNQMLK